MLADQQGGDQHLRRRAELARARRRRADVGRRERRGCARAHPRIQLDLALQRAAAHRRRHPARQHGRVLADRRRRPVPLAAERHQPRGDREHRDREGTRRGRALRHRGGERRHPDHHEEAAARARRAGTRSARSAGSTDVNDYPANYRSFGKSAIGRAAHQLQPVRAHDRQPAPRSTPRSPTSRSSRRASCSRATAASPA